MNIHTKVGQFKASPEALFSFLSNVENLPKWATQFCASVVAEGDDYRVTTVAGDSLYFKVVSDQATGVIDMHIGPTKDQLWVAPTRVASDNLGGSLFIFSYLQAPGQPDEVFEVGCQGLDEEFEAIRSLVE